MAALILIINNHNHTISPYSKSV